LFDTQNLKQMIGAVDIGGTKIAVGMVGETGQILAQTECPTAPELGLANGLDRITTMLTETAAKADAELRGIGIGCTGRPDVLAGTLRDVSAFLPGWEGANIVAELSSRFGVSVVIENDADAAALGEAVWGAGRGLQRFIYVTIGTGIGGGLVFDGQLYRGVDGAHPEIGHHVIDHTGPACFCGAHGCWESLASGSAMARWWRDHRPSDHAAPDNLDARQICVAAEQGDSHAMAAVEREGYYLGLGLGNLITLFAPEMIALGGGVMRSRHLFWEPMNRLIRANCGLVPHQKVRVVPTALGSEVGLIGAAQAWQHRYGRVH
jgi:glucokinase